MTQASIPYGKQSILSSDIEAVSEALTSTLLTGGPFVRRFEERLTEQVGASSVALTSGTAALHASYAAVGISRGNIIIAPPITFLATVAPAVLMGARVALADVDPVTALLDPASVLRILEGKNNAKVAAVVGVDYAGHPIDAPKLAEICSNYGIPLIEDAAHSVGSSLHGRPVGALADLTTFSFFPTKNFTTGEGGAVSGSNESLISQVRQFRDQGLARDAERDPERPWFTPATILGLNYRLSDILAALGLSQMLRIEAMKLKRNAVKARYDEAFADVAELGLPLTLPGADPMWHLYPVRVLDGRRRGLWAHLHSLGIGAQVNYEPISRHPALSGHLITPVDTPNATLFAEQELSLPMHPDLTPSEVDRVIDAVYSFFG